MKKLMWPYYVLVLTGLVCFIIAFIKSKYNIDVFSALVFGFLMGEGITLLFVIKQRP